MYELSVRQHFSAAHSLRDYPGDCQRLHGHNWEVEVRATGEELGSLGMVLSFADLKTVLRETLSELDHQHLNELPPFREENPTAENLARHLYRRIQGLLRERFQGVTVSGVQVWETPGQGVFYRE